MPCIANCNWIKYYCNVTDGFGKEVQHMTGSVFLNRKFYAQFCVFGEYCNFSGIGAAV